MVFVTVVEAKLIIKPGDVYCSVFVPLGLCLCMRVTIPLGKVSSKYVCVCPRARVVVVPVAGMGRWVTFDKDEGILIL